MRRSNKSVRMKRSLVFRVAFYWAKLACINPLTLSDDDRLQFSYCSLVYAIFLTIGYSFMCYYGFADRLKRNLPGVSPIGTIGLFITFASEYLEIIQTWMTFGFYQNRIKFILKSFVKAEKTSLKLDIRVDYEKWFKKLVISFTIVITTYLSFTIVTNAPSIIQNHFNSLISICYFLPHVTTFNRWIVCIWALAIVKEKFQRLNCKISFAVKNYDIRTTANNEMPSRLKKNSNWNSNFLVDQIQLIAQLHRELRNVIYRTVQHFAVCVVLDIFIQFLNTTISVHIAYRFLKNRKLNKVTDFLYLSAIGFWTFIPIGLLTLISNACGSTTDEANKTGKILHATLNDIDNFGEIQEVAMFNIFSLDLLENQLKISVLGFFHLDHYLVYRIITTATALLTIMLQFYN